MQAALREVNLSEVEVESYRELTVATVLLTAAAAVKLFTALVELRDKLKSKGAPQKLELKKSDGALLDLLKATDAMLKAFIDAAK
ncbi:hypothetical protein CDO81_10165 [Roseateles puraquae]|uniref:Uncharacterized protein n=1 Tax=Roseateles puraquae TaxID=431059 RepID=A0A254NCH6_9BURK|nr:hypothetical protein CDO81_10165 [Roseateles puraquae]